MSILEKVSISYDFSEEKNIISIIQFEKISPELITLFKQVFKVSKYLKNILIRTLKLRLQF